MPAQVGGWPPQLPKQRRQGSLCIRRSWGLKRVAGCLAHSKHAINASLHYYHPDSLPYSHPPEKAQSHHKASFLVPSCTGSQGLLERRENWSTEHSFLGSIWSADKQQRWILICLPSSKAIAYPKDDKYFNQCSACLAEVSLLLRDFPSFVPQTCPVHGLLPLSLGKLVIKSPSFVGKHIYFYDNCTLVSFSRRG